MISRRKRIKELKNKRRRNPRKSIVKKSSSMEVVPLDNTITLDSWMEETYTEHALLFDSLNVVPTTHNSGAVFANNLTQCIPWTWAKCQGYSIYDQLKMGIRCLDLRLKLVRDGSGNSHYQVVHFLDSTYTLKQVMIEIATFLNDNYNETVFVMMKPDWNTRAHWRFNDLDVMWKKLYDMDFVLKSKDCYLESEKILLNELRFKDVRGKVVIMPNGHFYHTYKNIATSDKVNSNLDIDCIHGIKIVYPNFLTRCENWDCGNSITAKRRIEAFLTNLNKETFDKEDEAEDDEDDIVLENNVFPLIESNVLLWKGVIPPYFACKFMHSYLKNHCVKQQSSRNNEICYVKRMGFVLVDFSNPELIRGLLSNNRCTN